MHVIPSSILWSQFQSGLQRIMPIMTDPTTVEHTDMAAATATPEALQEVQKNVKELKRRVISVTKLQQVFKEKDAELARLRQELDNAREQLEKGQSQSAASAHSAQEISVLEKRVEEKTHLAEKARTELAATLAKQKDAEFKLEEAEKSQRQMAQRLKATEMLKDQLEEKLRASHTQQSDLQEMKKELSKAQAKANTKMSEIADLRVQVMRAKAETGDRQAWLAEQKKHWEEEEAHRQGERSKQLVSRVTELEHQLDDVGTEHLLEMELVREELSFSKERLDRANEKAETLQRKLVDLTKENASLKNSIQYPSEDHIMTDPMNETLEEHDPAEARKDSKQSETASISVNQLDKALQSIEDLKMQFSVLRWVHDKQDTEASVETLTSQIKTLAKEKQALQDQLTRFLVERPIISESNDNYTPQRKASQSTLVDPASKSVSLPAPLPTPQPAPLPAPLPAPQSALKLPFQAAPKPALQAAPKLTQQAIAKSVPKPAPILTPVVAPVASDTIPSASTLVKRGRKRMVEEILEAEVHADEHMTSPVESQSPEEESLMESKAKKARKPRTVLSIRKPRTTTKAKTNTPTSVLNNIEIRNISLDPFVMSTEDPLGRFYSLMGTAIVQDSRLSSKLEALRPLFPEKQAVLFEAIVTRTRDIVPKVALYRQERDIVADDVDEWIVTGLDAVQISGSLSPAESCIVQLLWVLDRRFSELNLFSKWFASAYETILHDSLVEENLPALCILTRVVTGVCRAQGDLDRPRILAYDLQRELSKAKASLVLCEAIASVWPQVFILEAEHGPTDPRTYLLNAYQAVLSTFQEAAGEISFGYDTFIKKCSWPTLDMAPFTNELVESMMAIVRESTFLEQCQKQEGFEFMFRKALELLFVQGYEWIEVYNDYIKSDLLKMMIDKEKYSFAMALVAAVTHEPRCHGSGEGETSSVMDSTPIQQVLEAILMSQATIEHQTESALAIAVMSSGDAEKMAKVLRWSTELRDSERNALPVNLRKCLERLPLSTAPKAITGSSQASHGDPEGEQSPAQTQSIKSLAEDGATIMTGAGPLPDPVTAIERDATLGETRASMDSGITEAMGTASGESMLDPDPAAPALASAESETDGAASAVAPATEAVMAAVATAESR